MEQQLELIPKPLVDLIQKHIDEGKGLTAAQFDDKYNPDGVGEHPIFTSPYCHLHVADETTLLGYWEWVEYKIEEHHALRA